jgi:ABC-2 type transport system ATP-binding protein
MRNLLRRLGEMGKTIIVSSHILPELADICNKIGVVDRGVMSVNAEVADVMKQVRQYTVLHIRVRDNSEAAAHLLEEQEIVEAVDLRKGLIIATLKRGVDDYSGLAELLVQQGYRLTMFREEEINLESAFMALTKGMGAGGRMPESPKPQS